MKFGNRSKKRLSTCDEDLQKIMNLAIQRTIVDFGITEGHRSVERQQELFNQRPKVTHVDGVNIKSKHNYYPSKACDIYIYHPDKYMRKKIMYSTIHLSYVAGLIMSCADELYDKLVISHKLRWGANWDSDGIIALDQKLDDYPHFELV